MALFRRKKPPAGELSLEDMERELKDLGGPKTPLRAPTAMPLPSRPTPNLGPPRPATPRRPLPPRPMPAVRPAPKALPKPAPRVEEKKGLTEEDVAKLPLFMKLEDYDKIVRELDVLVNALKNMEKTMNTLTELGKQEDTQAERWRNQLETTKDQVKSLLAEMPETSKLKNLLGIKGKISKKELEKRNKEREAMQKELKKKEPAPDVLKEVHAMRDGIKGMQDEMKHVHLELQMLKNLTQLRTSKMAQEIKKELGEKKKVPEAKPVKKPKPIPRTKQSSPWD